MRRTVSGTVIGLLILFLFFPLIGYAQIGDPGGGSDPGVPITGIEWLLLGGGLLGFRKIYKNFKKH